MRDSFEEHVSPVRWEQLRQDAMTAWQDYQTTGLHLAFEEVDAYLAAVEAGEPADLPKCHT